MVTFNVISRDLLSWYTAKIVANSLPGWSFGQLGKAITSKNIFLKKSPRVLPGSYIYLLCQHLQRPTNAFHEIVNIPCKHCRQHTTFPLVLGSEYSGSTIFLHNLQVCFSME